MVNAETWLNGEEATQYFNVELVEENNAIAKVDSDYIVNNCKNIPENLNKKGIEEVKNEEQPIILTGYNLDYYKAKLKMYEI